MSDLDVIKEIEKIIGRELKPCPPNVNIMNETRSFLLNEQQQVIGLNLNNCALIQIDFLKYLPNLTQLYLICNKISNLSVLKYLPNLTMLNLSSNSLSDISILKELKYLTNLSLAANKISVIEELKNLNNITNLCLGNNHLKILPEWLLKLNLDIKIEEGYMIWTDENNIFVGNNPIEQPPIEIVIKGNRAILAYFNQLKKQGLDAIYEAKLILVGEGGAGKTSLANKIINPNWQLIPETQSESTKGIDILSYSFPYKDKIFRVNIWDFGGQEIYHQTHQFFLSKRSLYLIVADSRSDSPNLDYWFNLVELLSNNSPLLVIKNEKQDRKCTSIQESQLKAEFENIKDCFSTNLSDNRGLKSIIENLQHYLSQLPHIGSPLPKTWVKVREQLEHDDRYYLDLKEYFAICQANGFEIETDKRQLSGYLHDLGVCLHFQEHELLDKTLILKPTWATDAVYKVLDNSEVIKHSGRFSKDDLKQIWQAEQYSDMRGELLALMQKFKLCYEIPNRKNHYISPQLLEDKPPIMTGSPLRTASHGQDLLLRYKYDFMPKGILSQFIVEMHEYIAHNYQWVWKSGVILEMDNTQAEIIEYYGKREIHIRVHGNNKKELLNIVSYELDKINSSYERLKDKCKKLIPCNCEKCRNALEPHFYDYEKLKERIAHRKYTIECGNPPYMDVDILKLIDDINLPGFKNLEGSPTDKQFHFENCTFENSDFGKKKENKMSGDTIHATNYIKKMSGGNVAGRDINIQNNQGMTKDEFLQLLQAFKQDLSNSSLPADTVEIVTDDIATVEKQLQKPEPNKAIVKTKLEGINSLLDDANQTIDTVEKGNKLLNGIIETGKILIRAAGLLM